MGEGESEEEEGAAAEGTGDGSAEETGGGRAQGSPSGSGSAAEAGGEGSGNGSVGERGGVGSPTSETQQTRKLARTMVITPTQAETPPPPASTNRRVSFQQEPGRDLLRGEGRRELPAGLDTNDLKVPSGRYTPSVSPSPTPGFPPTPSDSINYTFPPRYLWRKRNSEWVFRPLKLKFKVKELEELYRTYVYRQQQSLVCTACLILFFLSVMVVIFFLANTKVCVCCQD